MLAGATGAGVAVAPAQTPRGPVTAASTLSPSKAATPAALSASRASTSRATSVVSDGRTPILSGQDAATDFRLRKQVLLANPELLTLHKELVMGGQITEAEFWEGREVGVFLRLLSGCGVHPAVDVCSTSYLQRQRQKTKNVAVRANS